MKAIQCISIINGRPDDRNITLVKGGNIECAYQVREEDLTMWHGGGAINHSDALRES